MNTFANIAFDRYGPAEQDRPFGIAAPALEVRLAETRAEVDAAQALRYQIFYGEMGAVPTLETARARRDADEFDEVCDHLLVLDRSRGRGAPFVCGTYRLLRRPVAEANRGFYTAQEFDLAAFDAYPGEIAECGRSCVHPDYRTGGVMQTLWRGIAEYLKAHDVRLLFGCASLPGTQPETMLPALSYLHHFHLAPSDFRPRALHHRYVAMDRIPLPQLDQRAARRLLPPLIKGYLRVGAFVGEGAVIDHQFNTTDACIIVPTNQITERYLRHYKPCGTP